MDCKICGAKNPFILFNESLNRYDESTKTYICTNCYVIYNPTEHSSDTVQEAFEASQAEVVSTYYKIEEGDIKKVHAEVAAKSGIVEWLLAEVPTLKRGTLVDIGTGSGVLAVAAGRFFNHVYATDLDISQAISTIQVAGQKNVVAVQDFVSINDKFDVAIMWHTMEHLFDPGQIIEAIKAKMNPGGAVFCQIPFYRKEYLENCHVWFYNPATIKKIKEIYEFRDYRVYFDATLGFMSFILFV